VWNRSESTESRLALLALLALMVGATSVARPAAAEGLLVMSQGTLEVLQYDAGDGSFTGPFASTISEGFRFPSDIALRPSDGVLYVSSPPTGQIWSYTTASGELITPAVATGLVSPRGIDFDVSGAKLYLADAIDVLADLTDSIKVLDVATGVVTTVGTDIQANFSGVAVNGGDVFATDDEMGRVIRFPISGGPGSVEISSGLSAPGPLLFLTPSQLLVADSGNDRVVEYLESGGSWTLNREVLGSSAGVDEPAGLALAPDGRLTVSGRQSGQVVLVDLGSLVVTELVAPGSGGLQDPKDLAWSGSTLLVASVAGNAIFYYDDTGNPTGVRASGLSPPLDFGIELSEDGSRLFVASFGGDVVVEYDVETGWPVRSFAPPCGIFALILDLRLGPDGDLYVSCLVDNMVTRFDGTTGSALGPFVTPQSGGLASPRGLDFGPNGNLFVASASPGQILEYDGTTGAPLGAFVDSSGNGGGAIDPYGVRFHQGVLYVSSSSSNEVKAFDATTGAFLSTFVSAGSGGLAGATALEFGPDGDLYVASQNSNAILRYDGSTGSFVEAFVPAGSGGLATPIDLAFSPGPAPPVPALPPFGSALLLLALPLAGVVAWRGALHEGGARR
jgi:WD40 repeat protein